MQTDQSRVEPDRIHAEYPRVENGLLNLLKSQTEAYNEGPDDKLRYAHRVPLKLNVGVEILPNASRPTPVYLSGLTRDVSLGGLCFIVDKTCLDSPSLLSSWGNIFYNAKVQVNFSVEELSVRIPATVVWQNTLSFEGAQATACGIQFDQMSPKLQQLLVVVFNSFN